MKAGEKRQTYFYGIIAAALFAVWLFAPFLVKAGGAERVNGKTIAAKIIVFGDSVMGEVRDETSVPAQLGQLLEETVYNAALGGTCAARVEPERRLDYTKDSLSLVGLAKSVEAEEFGVQQSIMMRESNTEYFEEAVDGLAAVDFSKVELVLLQQGINDYHAGVPIESLSDPYDGRTFKGAFRTAVRCLRRANPSLRIYIVTPTYTWYPQTGRTCEEADYGGGVLEEYVNAQLELAEELNVGVIDVYHDFYPHGRWEDWELYSRDGLHPNEAGREKLAMRIAECLK